MPSSPTQSFAGWPRRALVCVGVGAFIVLGFLGLWLFLKSGTGANWALSAGHEPARLKVLASRGVVGAALLTLATVALVSRDRTRALLREFFFAPAHPLNLAIFRVVIFGAIFLRASSPLLTNFFYTLPPDLQFPPETGLPAWGPLAAWVHWPVLTIPPATFAHLVRTLQVVSLLAALGVLTRWTALATAFLSIPVLGVSYFFGAVSHSYHYAVWCAFVLAASRSGDALSVDALVSAWRRADRGETEPPQPSPIYRFPLAVAMTLMGVTYFWPGIWKACENGLDWALSDNFKWILYAKWFGINWMPMVRPDRFPILLKLGALFALVLEIGFPFLILFPRLRLPTAAFGLAFHFLNILLLNIRVFMVQMASYVIFIDWGALFGSLGRWWWPEPLLVFYDGNCQLCRRTIALLRTFDWMGRIEYLNALDEESRHRPQIAGVGIEDLLTDMHAATAERQVKGYDAYVLMAERIPVLWLVRPFLSLSPVRALGMKIYRRVADSRTCKVARPPEKSAISAAPQRVGMPVMAISGVIFLLVLFAGATRVLHGWPVSCYPTFANMVPPFSERLTLEATDAAGQEIRHDFRDPFSERGQSWQPLFRKIRDNPDEAARGRQWQKVWEAASRLDPRLAVAAEVRLVGRRYSVDPAHRGRPPVETRIIHSWSGSATAAP